MRGETTGELEGLSAIEGQTADSIAWGFAAHLRYTLGVNRYTASMHDRFMSLAYAIRDRLIYRWMETQRAHYDHGAKRVYYLSLEFLIGRALANNVINMGLRDAVRDSMASLGYDWETLCEYEVDAGLGNGGLGRLAACFLDSMATLDIPAYGYGLRYDYGIFRQVIENGFQVEQPDYWLRRGNPWEIERHDITVPVHFGGRVISGSRNGCSRALWVETQPVMGVAYDTPVAGYGGSTVNTLRLWSTRAAEEFDFQDFNKGDYVEAVRSKVSAENLTKVLYPNDKLFLGKELRLKQQYFFVACSLHDILRRFKKLGRPWEEFPEAAAIQLNDTHPSLAIPELMRLLVDREGLDWDLAWDITVRTMGYTNHTLMPEALEKWPAPMLERLLPRHLQIIFLINHYFLQKVAIQFPGDEEKCRNVSLVEEGETKQIRMANLCIVGSHSTNGVAALHTNLLKSRLVPDLADIFPERFNSKTNGITQRRWLLTANQPLAELISDAIGDGWITDFDQIAKLKPFADDVGFRLRFRRVKKTAKEMLAGYIRSQHGWIVDPDTLFDVQVKRIHEYKRQLLNALHLIMLYNRLRAGRADGTFVHRTVLFGGKAAPGYEMAKLIIKLINNVASVINGDPATKGAMQVLFLPNYRVSLAEKIFPASDLSEQISTAGTEASGTGNMKFMCNGALTLGTLDGANIEIVEEVGRENAFIFGLTAEEAAALKPNYRPRDIYEADPEIKATIDLLASGHFDFGEPGIFAPILAELLETDQYLHLADLRAYADTRELAMERYRDQEDWSRRAILNVAASAKFSSDRAIRDYARDIWHVSPCRIERHHDPHATLDESKAELSAR